MTEPVNQPDRGIPVCGFSARVQAPADYLYVVIDKGTSKTTKSNTGLWEYDI